MNFCLSRIYVQHQLHKKWSTAFLCFRQFLWGDWVIHLYIRACSCLSFTSTDWLNMVLCQQQRLQLLPWSPNYLSYTKILSAAPGWRWGRNFEKEIKSCCTEYKEGKTVYGGDACWGRPAVRLHKCCCPADACECVCVSVCLRQCVDSVLTASNTYLPTFELNTFLLQTESSPLTVFLLLSQRECTFLNRLPLVWL